MLGRRRPPAAVIVLNPSSGYPDRKGLYWLSEIADEFPPVGDYRKGEKTGKNQTL